MALEAGSTRSRRDAAAERRAARAEVDDPDVVMEAAAAFLAVRPRSVKETRQRLGRLGYPAPLCDQVVERLVELGYLDDHAFATAWVESRDRARPRGRLALRRELQLKGVADAVIAAVLEEREARSGLADAGGHHASGASSSGASSSGASSSGASSSVSSASGASTFGATGSGADAEAATRLLERRAATLAREPDPRRRRQRAYSLLAGRGFTPDVCRDVAAAFVREAAPEGDDGAV